MSDLLLLAQDPPSPEWPQYVSWIIGAIALITGGLGGSILTALVTAHRNRLQPVHYNVDVDPILSPHGGPTTLKAEVTLIQPGGGSMKVDILSVATIRIKNSGNKDYQTFVFGISSEPNAPFVSIEAIGRDRHHTIQPLQSPTPSDQLSEVDFRCTPLNRGDEYLIKAYIHSNLGSRIGVKVSTSEPVNMVEGGVVVQEIATTILGSVLEIWLSRVFR